MTVELPTINRTARPLELRAHLLSKGEHALDPVRGSRVGLATRLQMARFSELTVFDARLYIGVRRIDEPGKLCSACGRSGS
jgi:hypothetical protein